MKRLNVLIVDDSAFMRKMLKEIINSQPSMQVLGTAKNGREALEMIINKSPDVVTMDVEMPLMDGLTALHQAMKLHPVPVIMLSSLTHEGAEATLKALDYGAVDFIPKPPTMFGVRDDTFKSDLIKKILIASKVSVKKHLHQRAVIKPIKKRHSVTGTDRRGNLKKIVAIGTSTGGPKALQAVIPHLSSAMNAAVVVVQHMPPGFTKSLADRLNGLSDLTVVEATHGETLVAGHCYIAPGDRHLKIDYRDGHYKIVLDAGAPVSGHRPSVDAMFNSLLDKNTRNIIAVIMTGMGADGANGIKALYDAGAHTVAQNKETCVVYGMPRAAVKLSGITEVMPLQSLADAITKALEE